VLAACRGDGLIATTLVVEERGGEWAAADSDRQENASDRCRSRPTPWRWPSASTSWAARNFDPKGLAGRSASEYATGTNLAAMIRGNLIAERIAVDHYRELVRFFGDDDATTRVMIESILTVEEEHVSDMQDLMAAHGAWFWVYSKIVELQTCEQSIG
jgi:hypothetical protein